MIVDDVVVAYLPINIVARHKGRPLALHVKVVVSYHAVGRCVEVYRVGKGKGWENGKNENQKSQSFHPSITL